MKRALKTIGVSTGQFGKNHLGDLDEMLPTNHGFDVFFGYLYHLNAEEEPEKEDSPKDPEFLKAFGPIGVSFTCRREHLNARQRRVRKSCRWRRLAQTDVR